MLQFCLTKKVRELLAFSDDMLSEPTESDAFLGNWYADIVYLEPWHSLLLISEKTYLSFVLLNVREEHSDMLANGFVNGLEHLLQEEQFAERSIRLMMTGLDVMNITPATNEQKLKILHAIGSDYSNRVAEKKGLDNCNILDIMKAVNRSPHPSLDNQTPIKATKTLLRNSDTALH